MNKSLPFNKINRLFGIVLFLMFSLQCSFAHDISGKWKISRKTLYDDMQLYYNSIKGKCRFKPDGTFVVTIKGSSPLHAVSAKARGRYRVVDNNIFLTVNPKDVKANIQLLLDNPIEHPRLRDYEQHFTWDVVTVKYDAKVTKCGIMEETVKEHLLDFFNVDNAPIVLIGKGLYIGDSIRLRK